MGNEVLVSSSQCAVLMNRNNTEADAEVYLGPYRSKMIETSAEYAQRCYSTETSSASDCGTFVQSILPVSAVTNASCPFGEKLCKKSSYSLLLDTGFLDSHIHLGLNSPESDRFQLRSVLHCAPLVTDAYRSVYNVSNDLSYTRYDYGTSGNHSCNCTFRSSNELTTEQQSLEIPDPILGFTT